MKEILREIYEILMIFYLKRNNPNDNSYLLGKAERYLENRLIKLKGMIDEFPKDKP